jgi:hypothetical protein
VTETSQPGHPPERDDELPRVWRRRHRDIAYVVWVSFLAAAVATMVFFATIDPEILSGYNTLGWHISRETGYALGFFGFWLLTATTSLLTIFLVRSEHRARDVPGLRARIRAARERRQRRHRNAPDTEGDEGRDR